MENKKIKNIALLLLSVLPIKVLAHYFIYTSSDKQFRIYQIDHSFAYHIYNIFNEEVWLFIPVILFVLFIGWYFGLYDLKRNSKSSFSQSKVVSELKPSSKEETQNQSFIEKRYYESGELFTEVPLDDGKPNGILKKYDKAGNLICKLTCKNGIEHGEEIQYYPSGEILSICNYINGKVEGDFKIYYQSGFLMEEYEYKNNLKDGKFNKYYDMDGFDVVKKSIKSGYITDKEGNKIKLKTTQEDFDKLYDFKHRDIKGKIHIRGKYNKGELDDRVEVLKENGDVKEFFTYENGKLNGYNIKFGKSGTRCVVIYKDDKPMAENFYDDINSKEISFVEYEEINKN